MAERDGLLLRSPADRNHAELRLSCAACPGDAEQTPSPGRGQGECEGGLQLFSPAKHGGSKKEKIKDGSGEIPNPSCRK